MWEAILDRLDDSKDLQNFCKAWKFPDFYTVLHRTKQSWLIDQVRTLAYIKNYKKNWIKISINILYFVGISSDISIHPNKISNSDLPSSL